jgi:hypothetical protein
MRKILWILALAGAVAVPGAVQAQTTFGPVAAFHDDADFGIGGYLRLPIPSVSPNLAIVPSFVLFFPDGYDFFEFNGDVTYSFASSAEAAIAPFALAGLNVARVSVDVGNDSASNTDLGLNLGGGVAFRSGSLQPFAGAKFEIQDGSALVIFGGLGFALGG